MTQRQPNTLYFLFMVELWERFGFYTMRSILVLYLTKVWLFSDNAAYSLFGAFTALVWLTPPFGGYLADRLFGFKKSLIIGGIVLTIGYALLAINNQTVFYYGLSLLLIGNGLFKPNIASLVGSLYDGAKDPRRDGGFTIYYMGINIGGLLAPLVTAIVVAKFGWQTGFLTAALGMFIGLVIFIVGAPLLGERGNTPTPNVLRQKILWGINRQHLIYLVIALVTVAGACLLHNVVAADWVLEILGSVIILFYLASSMQQTRADRNKMLGCLVLIIFSIAFWVLYQQAPMTVNLFTERNVNRHLFSWEIPTIMFQSLNPFFIVLFTPFLNHFWKTVARSRYKIPNSMKFAVAILLMSSGFLILAFSKLFADSAGYVSLWWVVFSYALQSLGELALQPIGLSMITALAPRNLIAMMVGTWFLASAASNAIAGAVAKFASISPDGQNNALSSLPIYSHVFLQYGLWALLAGLVSVALVPPLRKMMME